MVSERYLLSSFSTLTRSDRIIVTPRDREKNILLWKAKKNLKYDPLGNLNRYLYVGIKYRNIPKKLSVLHRWKIRNRNNLTFSFTFYAPDMQLWIKF